MKSLLFRPSLSRRVFLALIIAFILASAALTAKGLFLFQQEMEVDGGLGKVGALLAASVRSAPERRQAIQLVKVWEGYLNASFLELPDLQPLNVFLQLGTTSGELIYESSPTGHLLPGETEKVMQVSINGNNFDLFSYIEGQWVLRVAFPKLKKLTLSAAIFKGLVPDLALSFPFVLIPVWLGIRRGLRPLDVLSRKLTGRRDDDLSPLAIDMKYAELEQVVDAFESLLTRLRRKIENERSFLQDAAHELRTPMAVISAQAHVLARADNVDSRRKAESALIDAISRASHLSEQLLSLASLDHSRYLEKTSLDVAVLLQGVLAQMAPAAIARRIDLALEAPESLFMPMNRVAFHSIVQNLVDNALRYGLDGGHVVVSLREHERTIVLRVADDGPGISKAECDHIFDRFFRGRGQNATGTGLGLAIVEKATRAMGGRIRVDDGIDTLGVSFVISFPKPPLRDMTSSTVDFERQESR